MWAGGVTQVATEVATTIGESIGYCTAFAINIWGVLIICVSLLFYVQDGAVYCVWACAVHELADAAWRERERETAK